MRHNKFSLKGYTVLAISNQLYRLDIYKLVNAKIKGIDFITDYKCMNAYTKSEREAKALRDAYYN